MLLRYLPLHGRMKAIEQKRAEQKLAIMAGQAASQEMPILEKQLMQMQKEVENYEANIPAQRGLGVFLQQMATLMNELNLRGQVIAPGKEIKTEGLNCIPVNMQCKGRLGQIFEFFRRMQALERLIRIEQLSLVNESDFSGELSMQTEAVIYYRPQIGQELAAE